MKKKIAVGAGLGLALVAGATVVWAQSASQDVNLTATVPAFCQFTAVPTITPDVNIASAVPGSPSSSVTIASGANSTGTMQAWSFTYETAAVCNKGAQLVVTSQSAGLRQTGNTISSGVFLDRMDYSATAFWGATFTTLTTAGKTGPAVSAPVGNIAGPRAATMTIGVSGDLNIAAPLLAGTYTDTMTVSLTPNP